MGQILKQMKETLKKIFNKRVLAVLVVIFLITILFKYVVFPGLTVADSFSNILAVLIGIFSIVFVYHFIQWKDLIKFLSDKDEVKVVPPGETELDYLPKEELIKKKRNPKQSSKTKSEEPFVKTRKKTKINP